MFPYSSPPRLELAWLLSVVLKLFFPVGNSCACMRHETWDRETALYFHHAFCFITSNEWCRSDWRGPLTSIQFNYHQVPRTSPSPPHLHANENTKWTGRVYFKVRNIYQYVVVLLVPSFHRHENGIQSHYRLVQLKSLRFLKWKRTDDPTFRIV